MSIQSINPFNGQVLKTFESFDNKRISEAIDQTYNAFHLWKNTDLHERAARMYKMAGLLEENKKYYGGIITIEMGKAIKESIAEVEKCSKVCYYYADNAARFLADEPLDPPHGNAWIHYNPLGPILAIMPWNFPFWQVFRFVAPALMAGNTALLKHASNVPQCALAIEEIVRLAGFPDSVFRTLLIGASKVEIVLNNPKVVAATLTGSENAGSNVAEIAGRNLKKTVLELGGSDPFIVLHDADLKKAAEFGAKARMINCGQSCIAGKRFIIEDAVFDEYLKLYSEQLDKLQEGDPLYSNTDLGPLARQDLAEELQKQVTTSLKKGATLLYGKVSSSITNAQFPPLIIGDAQPGTPAYDEEMFGPVAIFFRVKDMADALRIANDSQFGLGASVWTTDRNAIQYITDGIEVGAVYVNQMMFSDPSVPFGGIKRSGYGRELSHLGIREFTNQKTVWLAD